MVSTSLILAALLAGAAQDRPDPAPITPFPTDEELVATFAAAHPTAQVLTLQPTPAPPLGSRVLSRKMCGTARIEGRIEPFVVLSQWRDPAIDDTIVSTFPGGPRPIPETAGWKARTSFPVLIDHNGEGEIDRHDRNLAVMARHAALMVCQDLRAPEGVQWVIKPEAADPVR